MKPKRKQKVMEVEKISADNSFTTAHLLRQHTGVFFDA